LFSLDKHNTPIYIDFTSVDNFTTFIPVRTALSSSNILPHAKQKGGGSNRESIDTTFLTFIS
jgi:hypothetical protein